MCLQCNAEAVTVLEDVLPGYKLMVATKNHDRWPVGYYGLVWSDDPDVVFPGEPVGDPTVGMTDEEIDAHPVVLAHATAHDRFVELAEPHFNVYPTIGHRLVTACMEVGYDPGVDGIRVVAWIVNRLAQLLNGEKAERKD